MAYETILAENNEAISRITLNRPAALNAFNARMHEELQHALTTAETDSKVRVIILTGSGRGFCAGQDVSERKREPGAPPFDLGATIENLWEPLAKKLAGLSKPIIAAVNGVAAGAGVSIALACDIVIARKNARFIQSFVNIGLIPDTGGSWLLPRLVGLPRALGMTLTGEPIDAETAAEWGMIWKAADDNSFNMEVSALADRLAALPPLALAGIKQTLRSAFERTLDEQLLKERNLQQSLGFSDDYAEGVAAFLAKRPPVFQGR